MACKNIGAPFPKRYDTAGVITDINADASRATVMYHDKDGALKKAEFAVTRVYEVGELVAVQTADEFVFVSKASDPAMFPPDSGNVISRLRREAAIPE